MVDRVIHLVDDGKPQHRDIDAVGGIMLHRVGVDLRTGVAIGYEAVEIAEAFIGRNPRWRSVSQVTGSQNAYTFYIGGDLGPGQYDGRVWQALPLDEIGHHGLRFSKSHIGIACVGDFRVKPPSEKQWNAAVDLCADLCLFFGVISRRIVGHGEVPGSHNGAKAPGKPAACPGDLWGMTAFRQSVRQDMRSKIHVDAAWRLEQVGTELP
jgi:hypothetical protein